jgi:hypothetical protein
MGIELYKSGNCWMSRTIGGVYEEECRRLFGTNEIPTAFTAQAEPETVRREIQALNPALEVVLL